MKEWNVWIKCSACTLHYLTIVKRSDQFTSGLSVVTQCHLLLHKKLRTVYSSLAVICFKILQRSTLSGGTFWLIYPVVTPLFGNTLYSIEDIIADFSIFISHRLCVSCITYLNILEMKWIYIFNSIIRHNMFILCLWSGGAVVNNAHTDT